MKKRILIIPDLHGKDCWKRIINESCHFPYDKIVFLGDYCDSFTHTDEQILNNLADVIAYKKANPEQVVLLMGNHDIQYMFQESREDSMFTCSGRRWRMNHTLGFLFNDNKSLFQAAYEVHNKKEKILFTHAGVTNRWHNTYREMNLLDESATMADKLNALYQSRHMYTLAVVPGIRGGLFNQAGGPFWADKTETQKDMLTGYRQYVGHTPVPDLISIDKNVISTDNDITYDTQITFCDIYDKHPYMHIYIELEEDEK